MRKDSKREKYTCDRCGFNFKKHTLKKQRGMLLCGDCFDDVLEIKPVNIKWLSPRTNATSTDAVTSPTVFSVTTAGLLALTNSQARTRDGVSLEYFMCVVGSGGAITVTGSPQIVAGTSGQQLTLKGTSDTNTVTFSNGDGLSLTESITLKNNVVITMSYSTTASVWMEVSRGFTI